MPLVGSADEYILTGVPGLGPRLCPLGEGVDCDR